MPDKYEELYVTGYGTETTDTGTGNYTESERGTVSFTLLPAGSGTADLYPANLAVASYAQDSVVTVIYDPAALFVSQDYGTLNVELIWEAPTMPGATHVAGFRRSGTDTTVFTPTPLDEHFRVPVGTTYYLDQNVPAGNYVYQVFSLVES